MSEKNDLVQRSDLVQRNDLVQRSDLVLMQLLARSLQHGGRDLRDFSTVMAGESEAMSALDALHEAIARGLAISSGRIVLIANPEKFMMGDLNIEWSPGKDAALLIEGKDAGVAVQVSITKVKMGDGEVSALTLTLTPFKPIKKKKDKDEEEDEEETLEE